MYHLVYISTSRIVGNFYFLEAILLHLTFYSKLVSHLQSEEG